MLIIIIINSVNKYLCKYLCLYLLGNLISVNLCRTGDHIENTIAEVSKRCIYCVAEIKYDGERSQVKLII